MTTEKKYTPEVEKLLLAARGLYDAAARAKLTPGLAVALRDGIGFDKLQDTEILALSRFVRELEKAARPPEAGLGDGSNGSDQAPVTGEIVSKPDDKKGKGGKGGKNADSTP